MVQDVEIFLKNDNYSLLADILRPVIKHSFPIAGKDSNFQLQWAVSRYLLQFENVIHVLVVKLCPQIKPEATHSEWRRGVSSKLVHGEQSERIVQIPEHLRIPHASVHVMTFHCRPDILEPK